MASIRTSEPPSHTAPAARPTPSTRSQPDEASSMAMNPPPATPPARMPSASAQPRQLPAGSCTVSPAALLRSSLAARARARHSSFVVSRPTAGTGPDAASSRSPSSVRLRAARAPILASTSSQTGAARTNANQSDGSSPARSGPSTPSADRTDVARRNAVRNAMRDTIRPPSDRHPELPASASTDGSSFQDSLRPRAAHSRRAAPTPLQVTTSATATATGVDPVASSRAQPTTAPPASTATSNGTGSSVVRAKRPVGMAFIYSAGCPNASSWSGGPLSSSSA